MSRKFQSAGEVADAVIERVGKEIVLGLPIGIGRAVHIADALFERAAADPSLSLSIFTGLTLEPPRGKSDLERRFIEPLAQRLYADCPVPRYAQALRQAELPSNIQVREFYLRPGAYLGNPRVQQSYTSINYSQVTAALLDLGVNVIAQLVAARPESPGRLSLGANPEITLDLLPALDASRRAGRPVAIAGQLNSRLPYMTGDAELPAERFDFLLESEATDHPLFPLPNRPVGPADYATAMHVASLVPDGGTLQIGIGSLSDAVAHCLILRHRAPEIFQQVLRRLPGGATSPRRQSLPVEDQAFSHGLFASTELLSDALYVLFEAGVLRRPADEQDDSLIHAGFFIGSSELYRKLSSLDEARRRRIRMMRISYVNTLFGEEQQKRRQRRHARFVNETMMVTLLGAAISDALDQGRVVSGVGGQFDFVSMAQSLEDARSILMVRARRRHKGVPRSNIRWSYAHTTVPRHHRDLFVSEYGVAATRGRTDSQVIDAMLSIADSAFQPSLLRAARRARKLPAGYKLPVEARENSPEKLAEIFEDPEFKAHFPVYPLGTELTEVEQELVTALGWLEAQTARPWTALRTLAAALRAGDEAAPAEAVTRMGLSRPDNLKERVQRRLLELALRQSGV